MTAPDKDSGPQPVLTLSDQLFGNNLSAGVAKLGVVAIALAAIYAVCRLLGWLS
jgi:hypothetical protein